MPESATKPSRFAEIMTHQKENRPPPSPSSAFHCCFQSVRPVLPRRTNYSLIDRTFTCTFQTWSKSLLPACEGTEISESSGRLIPPFATLNDYGLRSALCKYETLCLPSQDQGNVASFIPEVDEMG